MIRSLHQAIANHEWIYKQRHHELGGRVPTQDAPVNRHLEKKRHTERKRAEESIREVNEWSECGQAGDARKSRQNTRSLKWAWIQKVGDATI